MRIVIDLQACQAPESRNRGIGRYSLSLTKAIIEIGTHHEFWILLNSSYPKAVNSLRAIFAQEIPAERFVIFTPVESAREVDLGNPYRSQVSESIRNSLIEKIAPDAVLVCSLFEGSRDDCAVSVPKSSVSLHAVVLYDLIPLLNSERYLSHPDVKAWYMRKVESLARADLLLGISESASREALGIDHCARSNVVTISSAVDSSFFTPSSVVEADLTVPAKYGLVKPFVMYTGGIDWRKNLEALIRAFALLPPILRDNFQLALVCHSEEGAKRNLLKLARQHGLREGDVIVTGFVSDEELRALYRLCRLFVFPSLHEGFGLPALEAMSCGAPVIGSRSSSIPEVIGRDDALFDPASDTDISEHIWRGLLDDSWRQELLTHAPVQAAKFSWKLTGSRALSAIEQSFETKCSSAGEQSGSAPVKCDKPRLAMVTPMQPVQSGIADYVDELLPALAMYYDITAICDAPEGVQWRDEDAVVPIRSVKWFREHAAEFDRIVYQFGNSEYHAHMFGLLLTYPGVVVLHDFFLSGVLSWMQNTGYRSGAFANALARSHGQEGRRYLQQHGLWRAVEKYPCCSFVLERALGVVVHSDYSVRMAQEFFSISLARKMRKVPHHRVLPHEIQRNEARKVLGLSSESFLVCTFGFLGPTKLNDRLVRAWFKSSLAKDVRCRLVFVGKNDPGPYGASLEATISSSSIRGQIQITGFAERELFERYLAAADLGVQLRTQSRGETSGAVLDCMAYGVPVLLNANGSMGEYSVSEVFKLPDEFDDDSLVGALERLYSDEELRKTNSRAGVDRIRDQHTPQLAAGRYQEIIEDAYCSKLHQQEYWDLVQVISAIPNRGNGFESDLAAAAKALSVFKTEFPPKFRFP